MKTNETLEQSVNVSMKQFQEQDKFNAYLGDNLNKADESFTENTHQQNQFNERFLNKLDDIEKALKK